MATKSMDEIEAKLKTKFDECFETLATFDEKLVYQACDSYGLKTRKVENYYVRTNEVQVKTGMTPVEVSKLVVAEFKKVPKGYTIEDGRYCNSTNFTKTTPLYKNKFHAINSLKNKIELDLLLSSTGRNKGHINIMAEFVKVISNLKNSADNKD